MVFWEVGLDIMTTNQPVLINQTFNQFATNFPKSEDQEKISADYKTSWEEFKKTKEFISFLEEFKTHDKKLSAKEASALLTQMNTTPKMQKFFFTAFIFKRLHENDKPLLNQILGVAQKPHHPKPQVPSKEDDKKDLIIQDLMIKLAAAEKAIVEKDQTIREKDQTIILQTRQIEQLIDELDEWRAYEPQPLYRDEDEFEDQLEERLSDLRQELDEARDEITDLEDKVETLEEELERVTDELEETSEELGKIRQKREGNLVDLARQKSKIEKLERQIRKQRKEIESFEEQLAEQRERNELQWEQIQSQENSNTSMEDEIRRLEDKLFELVHFQNAEENETIEILDAYCARLKKEKKKLEKELEKAKSIAKRKLSEAKGVIAELEKKLQKSQEEHSRLSQCMTELQKEVYQYNYCKHIMSNIDQDFQVSLPQMQYSIGDFYQKTLKNLPCNQEMFIAMNYIFYSCTDQQHHLQKFEDIYCGKQTIQKKDYFYISDNNVRVSDYKMGNKQNWNQVQIAYVDSGRAHFKESLDFGAGQSKKKSFKKFQKHLLKINRTEKAAAQNINNTVFHKKAFVYILERYSPSEMILDEIEGLYYYMLSIESPQKLTNCKKEVPEIYNKFFTRRDYYSPKNQHFFKSLKNAVDAYRSWSLIDFLGICKQLHDGYFQTIAAKINKKLYEENLRIHSVLKTYNIRVIDTHDF